MSIGCGLQPARFTVRVKAERVAPDRLLLHNYDLVPVAKRAAHGCTR